MALNAFHNYARGKRTDGLIFYGAHKQPVSGLVAMSALPRSQGVGPGVLGLIFLILLCLAGIAFVTPQLWTQQGGWTGIPFLIVLVIGAATFSRALATRVRTLLDVSRGRFSIVKTLSQTEGLVGLQGLPPQEALQRCFRALGDANGYSKRTMGDKTLTATMKRTFARSHVRCSISVVGNSLRIQFEREEGGAIWADAGRFEREIHRLVECIHTS